MVGGGGWGGKWSDDGRLWREGLRWRWKKRMVEYGSSGGLCEPRGYVRLQMYTQCCGAQANGWITEGCCFCRAARCSSLCASFYSVPRAAIQRRAPRRLSYPKQQSSLNREALLLMKPLEKQPEKKASRGPTFVVIIGTLLLFAPRWAIPPFYLDIFFLSTLWFLLLLTKAIR